MSLEGSLPFDKSSSVWKSIESMGVFRRLPQDPHFGPLEQQYPREFVEGMAIGLMVSFAKLEAEIRELNTSDSQAVFEVKMKALKYLEENGFNVHSLQSQIESLQIRKSLIEIENRKVALKEQLLEKELEKQEIDTEKYLVDEIIKERKEQLTHLGEKQDALVAREMKKKLEMTELEKEVHATREANLAAVERFRALAAAQL